MGMVIWFKRQDFPTATDSDRLYLFREADYLDTVAVQAGVSRLSEFFDYTDLNANISDDYEAEESSGELATWHDPALMLETLEALHSALTAPGDALERQAAITEGLVNELRESISLARAAKEAGAGVHFCVVM